MFDIEIWKALKMPLSLKEGVTKMNGILIQEFHYPLIFYLIFFKWSKRPEMYRFPLG